MAPLQGFTDNHFRTREDCIQAVYALLGPLKPFTSPEGARIRFSPATGAHFDDVAAQLEGFARPLWAVAPLLAENPSQPSLLSWIQGLKAGTDPFKKGGLNVEFWGQINDTDQRMVEAEIIGYAILTAPDAFLPALPATQTAASKEYREQLRQRENIITYLKSMNGKPMPRTNWLWFRVIANLALVKTCSVPYSELKPAMDADFDVLDSFYLGNGWSSDGEWNENGKQADYYSGSFAIQFSQLLYIKHAAEIDPRRCNEFKKRAREFASVFWRYFAPDGSAIPFGRSLTYRFTFAAFWSALALSGIELPDGFELGHAKGIMLRHLRWWSKQPDIFNSDGTLNIGFCFPNMYACEDYNSPQSPYWCMKTFVAIALPKDHPFWTCEELPLPLTSASASATKSEAVYNDVKLIKESSQILIHSGAHHFLLSSGQYCGWPLKATEAKYGKFAYSSSFGFSVPTGTLIQQIAPDSTLAISEDEGETWKVRWKSQDVRITEATLKLESGRQEKLLSLTATWSPNKRSNLKVQTTLVPPSTRWPDWHIRVHRISKSTISKDENNIVELVEGGFAIHGRNEDDGGNLPVLKLAELEDCDTPQGCCLESDATALVLSHPGASGIAQLTPSTAEGSILKPDSNTNLISQRTLIPTIKQSFVFDEDNKELVLIVAVFAMSSSIASFSTKEILQSWHDKPIVHLSETIDNGDYIQV